MKKHSQRTLYRILVLAAVYAVLVFVMLKAESVNPDASIHNVYDVIWYTLTTLTTVGYGDMYPVSTLGRLIGMIFLLLSLGFLALLVGLSVSFLRNRLIPVWYLRSGRGRKTALFNTCNAEAEVLAAALRAEDDPYITMFAGTEGKTSAAGMTTVLTVEELLKHIKDTSRTSVFCVSENEAENRILAGKLRESGCSVYCESTYEPDRLPEHEHMFDVYSICARMYWNKYPLKDAAERIVLIGSGMYAEALLEQGLLQNVCDPRQNVSYHCIGDYAHFRRNHPALEKICTIGSHDGHRDSIIFADVPWNDDLTLLREADRVIICTDTEEENLSIVTELFRYNAVKGSVYARVSVPVEGITVFGSAEEIWTPELITKASLNRMAMELNEIYRAQTGGKAAEWKDLSSFTRRSNLASADHLPVKVRILLPDVHGTEFTPDTYRQAYEAFRRTGGDERERLRMIEHERWVRFHLMNGWSYAPVRNNIARQHPLLVPYEELSVPDREKDDYAWEILKVLSETPHKA